MHKIIRIIISDIYFYGFPMLVAAVPYYVFSAHNNDAATVLSIIMYVFVFIVNIITSGKTLQEFIDGK